MPSDSPPRPRRLAAVLVALALALVLPAAAPVAAQQQPEQFRAYWVDAFGDGIYNADQVDELVAAVKAANFNAIIAQVGRRGDCFCNSSTLPRTQAFIDPLPYDPLQTLIDAAHAEGIEVHAWMNVGTMWNLAAPPADPDHAFNLHGPSAQGRDYWPNVRSDGADKIGNNTHFDLGHPDVVDYLVGAYTSIAANYDVDGINLDYVRYPDYNLNLFESSWGYNPTSLARFQDATGREDAPEPSDEQWSDWRRDQVSGLVRKTYLSLYETDPSVRLSVNAVTYAFGPQTYGGWEQTRPYSEVMQDWRGWMREGIVDLNVPMNYKREFLPDQQQMYEEWNEVVADWQYDRQAIVGSAAYLNSITDTVTQIRKALAPTAAGNATVGWTAYSYRNPDSLALSGSRPASESRAELAKALTEPSEYDDQLPPLFAEPAAVPEMTWKTQPTTGHVAGSVIAGDGTIADQTEVDVYTQRGHRLVATATTDGSGWFGVVDLEPGRYRVMLASGSGPRATWVDVTAGTLSHADLSPNELQ